ncbi:hypothetical protein PHLCEN_2v10247 [Hermanssonia centrifuga]|uniref:Uncharacterized protein n=1 Tax=Hermanssonia centrifuga TaxID=98765 RepID=A0A2R6NNG4_9APHY|nr:hypothetical protein PHLCEN_2v10247 [Hermanssonia centrifuga]
MDHLSTLKYQLIETEVIMGIEKRWEPQDDKYLETLKYAQTRQYHRALDHLQKLVVQRLFELQKLNLAETVLQQTIHELKKEAHGIHKGHKQAGSD